MTAVAFDIGGAHLKVARAANGMVTAAREVPCPLWLGIDQLDAAFAAVSELAGEARCRAITMTGELTEIFESRIDGVEKLIQAACHHLGPDTLIFAGLSGLYSAKRASADPMAVASANFLATSRVVAEAAPHALLIDFGSTTADIIVCDRPMGLTDAERLQTGELVYTGMTRTPVPSVVRHAPLAGQWQGIAADAFATMGDVRMLLSDEANALAASGSTGAPGERAVAEALKRFSRGFGRDGDLKRLAVWQATARYIRDAQLQHILAGVHQVLSRPGTAVTRVVTAGIGAADAATVAARLGLPAMSFGELVSCETDTVRLAATAFAPAAALALLADRAR